LNPAIADLYFSEWLLLPPLVFMGKNGSTVCTGLAPRAEISTQHDLEDAHGKPSDDAARTSRCHCCALHRLLSAGEPRGRRFLREMPQRILGKTGIKVSILGLGGYHIGKPSDDAEGIGIIRAAIDNGITFMDNCWDYNDGASEIRMGKALRDGYREKVFLMTKIDGRTKEAAARQIDESLRRLQTDRIDLLQFHEVIRESDPRRIFAEGGAMEAVREARTTGKIRFIGFTGHKSPDRHLQMLQAARDNDITFDAVQMPLNVMDAHFSSFEKRVLPLL